MAETILNESKDLEYLSTKRVELSSPGIKLQDQYYSVLNSQVELAECTYNLGRYTVSLSQLNMGSSSQILIPNSSLLGKVFLHLELPPLVFNQTLTSNFGYKVVESISYIWGSSNVSQIIYSGATMWSSIAAQADTSEKLSELAKLAGTAQFSVTGEIPTADILLELPCSNACGLSQKKPYDTSMINSPIVLTITFKQSNTIYGGTAVPPAAFTRATIVARQGDFTNKDQSLSMVLRKDPSLMYTYPFIHHQTFTPGNFTGSISSASPVTINLTGIINADLVSLSFYCVQTSNLISSAGSSPNPFLTDSITNPVLSFNGLVMYSSPGSLWKLVNMDSSPGASYWNDSIITSIPGGGLAPYQATPVNSYILFIDFSRIRAQCFTDKMANVWRLGNNTLSLSFNTTTTNQYSAFLTYNYNGIIETSQSQTKIYFD
jgi:hypothetical protein